MVEMIDSDTPVAEIAKIWVDRYGKNPKQGLLDLVNFCVEACGLTQTLPPGALDSDENIETLLGIPDSLPVRPPPPFVFWQKRFIFVWS